MWAGGTVSALSLTTMKNRIPRGLKAHAFLGLDGIVFNVQVHTNKGAVMLPTTVKMGEDDPTLSTAADHPVEFGRPGKHGVRTGVRIHLDRADATDLIVARSFINECLSLFSTTK